MNSLKRKTFYAGKISTVSAVVLAVLAMPVWAADTKPDTTVQTKDIIVTATKTETDVKAVPQAVEVITAEEIQRMGANDVLTALSLANNLNLSRAGMTGNTVSLRGMSTNHALILVDGKRYAGEDTNVTANVYSLQRLNVSDIDRIEIVRGPSSSLYGSDAMGGVINIITKSPEKATSSMGVVTGTRNIGTYWNVATGKQGRWSTSFNGRVDKIRPISRPNNSVNSSYMGFGVTMTTTTSGIDRFMYGMRRLYHLSSIYDFENENKNKLKFDVDYMKEDLRSDYADRHILVEMTMIFPMFMANKWTSRDKKEWFHNTQKGVGVEYSGKTKHNEYQFRTYYNQLEKNSNVINHPIDLLNMTSDTTYDMDYAKYHTWVTEAKDTMYIGNNHNVTFGGEYRRLAYKGTRLGGSAAGLHKKLFRKK